MSNGSTRDVAGTPSGRSVAGGARGKSSEARVDGGTLVAIGGPRYGAIPSVRERLSASVERYASTIDSYLVTFMPADWTPGARLGVAGVGVGCLVTAYSPLLGFLGYMLFYGAVLVRFFEEV